MAPRPPKSLRLDRALPLRKFYGKIPTKFCSETIEPYSSRFTARGIVWRVEGKMIWDYLSAEARERRSEREHDEFVAELARKKGKTRTAEFLERIGFLGRIATYFVLFGVLLMWYPGFDVFQKPLAEVTISGILSPLVWLGACFVFLRALFQPSKHPHVRQFWGIWTICLAVIAVVVATYFGWIRW